MSASLEMMLSLWVSFVYCLTLSALVVMLGVVFFLRSTMQIYSSFNFLNKRSSMITPINNIAIHTIGAITICAVAERLPPSPPRPLPIRSLWHKIFPLITPLLRAVGNLANEAGT